MAVEKFVWDLTYACPLRCSHCYSESGRRPAATRRVEDMLRIADVIVASGAKRVSVSGGEPLLVDGWEPAARRLRDAGVQVTLFTSGWVPIDGAIAARLAGAVHGVCVSVDGAREQTHDAIRGRAGSHRAARAALGSLARYKREHPQAYRLFVDFTVVRSNIAEMDELVEDLTKEAPEIDAVRFGMAIPEGMGASEAFARDELLSEAEMLALHEAASRLSAKAHGGVAVHVQDMRYYLLHSTWDGPGKAIAHLEPDGQLRAFGVYQAKVGSVLEEPFEVLWARALSWRELPDVVAHIRTIDSPQSWAAAARALDERYGSEGDRLRLARRARAFASA